ncbi:hypothetical protein Kpol_1058p24 [Vanderwaltozyma polyspora DSM 70294]|uniref:DUF3835 domain-containing protein n=1 Tax=Vanderwaltozyma polyspora (strain ATCC 22028 / DSM 70294 / BCRC 21397 / CBS 2163 / NBRC 10782 / NRRL Y-8283 / UCD 57-17) TaxID=436907 RepID=A7TJQ8_VANPO|nr:uncharacterized protein Kpol_1058p24 [Vanderwaltozyma polyspora DSM 70294]EDO17487.1 hypothetical protein Kpol_1058p24 [Vanderwaltozyma polyspora DSM 70294]
MSEVSSELRGFLESVPRTIRSLEEKRAFLEDQKGHYLEVRDKVVSHGGDSGDSSDGTASGGMVFGEVIIGESKLFLNIGYEYYVEKSREEILIFLDEKLKLMEEAMVQFDGKIAESKQTLSNLELFVKSSEGMGGENSEEMDYSDGFQPMEIREELDEDGNVISSSVTPTNKNGSSGLDLDGETGSGTTEAEAEAEEAAKTEVISESGPSFEDTLRGKLTKEVNEVPNIDADNQDNMDRKQSKFNQNMDSSDMYTFADLVEQMDEQDELDNGVVNSDDITYDYDAFENEKYYYSDDEDEDDDDDDLDNTTGYSMIPGFAAQSSFMAQINKLRAENASIEPEKSEQEAQEASKTQESKAKSILKSGKKGKKKAKKSVGFAASLDIHEVENMKEETKKNTHNFPRYQGAMSGADFEDNEPLTKEEFDSELFAKMIGVLGPDEIHDKYLNEIAEEYKKEEEEAQAKRKNRVSRFKLGRKSVHKDDLAKEDVIEKGISAVNDIVEKEPDSKLNVDNKIVTGKKKLSSFRSRNINKSKNIMPDIVEKENIITEIKENEGSIISDIVDKEFPAVSDIVEREEPVSDIVEKEIPVVSDIVEKEVPVVSDIIEKDVSLTISDGAIKKEPRQFGNKKDKRRNAGSKTENQSYAETILETAGVPKVHGNKTEKTKNTNPNKYLSKSMNSLSKPRVKSNKPVLSKEIKEYLKNSDDIEDPKEQSEIEQHDNSKSFPKEIADAIKDTEKKDIKIPSVDFSALSEDMNAMAKAYSLGLYDDDLEDDPGMLVEKLEDFKEYNDQVNELKEEIENFRIDNPMKYENDNESESDSNEIMTEIVENNIPDNYNETNDEIINDYGLNQDKLNESVAMEYHRVKSYMTSKLSDMSIDYSDESKGIEPIDELGNPIKQSRFKSNRLSLNQK